ncbi:MAG: alpha/beta fold hydrolase [Hyphomicrobiales bacterium]
MEKTPLILIPGLLCTKALWAAQTEALSDIAECHVPDHTRHDTMAGIVRSILDDAPERFALAGLSMGGYIALEIMEQAPERVTRLALLDTTAGADNDAGKSRRKRLIEQARHDFEKFLKDAWLPYMLPEGKENDEALIAKTLQMARETGVEAYCRQQTAILNRSDARGVCETVSCPTTIIVGNLDKPTPVAGHQEMHELIAGSQLHIIPNCGHLSTLEAPNQVSKLLRHWLTN